MRKLEEIVRKLREKLEGDVKVITQVLIGIPPPEIAEYANGKNIDIIVVLSAGENIWRRMFVGSTRPT